MSEKAKQPEMLTVVETAERLFVTERTVRNWLKGNGLQSSDSARGRLLDWRMTLAWYVLFRREELGSGGNGDSSSEAEDHEETYEAALSRKTRAEADLKELQLAKARGEVASIADVERVLAASNLSVQTQVLAVPSRLASQMLGLEDHGRAVAILESEMRQILSNLATIDAVHEANSMQGDDD